MNSNIWYLKLFISLFIGVGVENLSGDKNTMTRIAVIFITVIICTFHFTNAQLGSADVSPLLRNPAVVQKQINCVLDKGPCDSTGRQLKVAIPEVINRNCASCTPAQARNARKVVAFVRQKYPSAWTAIQAKYRG